MDEHLYTKAIAFSEIILQQNRVEQLRDLSKQLLKKISSLKKGVCVIHGIRGSGKTTLLTELYQKEKHTLFVTAEHLLKYGIDLLDFLHYALAKGHSTYIIDEIHALPTWEKDIKLFYDETKSKIIVSGSSALALKVKGSELARRASFYELKPLSFREYILFKTGKRLPQITLKELLDIQRRQELEQHIRPYIPYFDTYTQFDALPAALFEKNPDVYLNILERIARFDLTSIQNIDAHYLTAVFQAMKIISTSPPGEVSYTGLSSALRTNIKFVREMIYSLSQTGILHLVSPSGRGTSSVRKEEKILMPLSFRSALCTSYGVAPPKGSIREDFFVQHVPGSTYLKTGVQRRTPDFVVQDHIFEVGGPSKGSKQIQGMKNAYLVKEVLTTGEKEIPLYLFGLLY
ncbi:hypothetical protein CMO92_05035 [Candidatus Woesearchaeota archaeon]|nr:hypothetical protein [Candidatus Woesearchaeota archaeon]|tara:strand:- start:608 stop:1816 length:1209 start_codon:yes stop_codon:yes gene_type:complete